MKFIHLFIMIAGLAASSFVMATEKGSSKSALAQADPSPIEISAYDSCLHVKNAPAGSTLEIYSVVGIKVKEIKIKASDEEYPVNIPKGYYIIRIGEIVRKVVIR